ncbi:hypothetical protein [Winogradskyella sp.]|uniref:hypothetical protein n=1 Tax=Winogradskyella sp. TaxID=1883156 RepID=UPI001B096403|nr:hypothetical protein [Winogradskyella sp.]MBO6879594.1 hypothetical protein [Winogradskyella sp.]
MKYILTLLISFLIFNCSSYKKNLIASGSENQAIRNIIIDFTNTSRLYKKYNVFEVKLIDTLYNKVLEKIDEQNYRWVDDQPNEGIIAVDISPITNEFTYLLSDSLGINNSYLPSKYIEQDGKLFFWNDKTIETSNKTVEVLKKYNLIGENYLNSTFVVDESQKGVHYFVCRNNFTKFKKKTTNIGIGYYDAPKVECE